MTRTRGIWVIVALGVAFAAPGLSLTAHAGCGDYVVIGGSKKHQLSPTGHHAPSAQHDMPAPDRKPCSGPGCSQRNAPLPSSPSTPVTGPNTDDRWGQGQNDLALVFESTSFRLPEANLPQPRCSLASVYHPPR